MTSGDATLIYRVRGLVQGVGFRPAIWRLAHSLQLRGWVLNDHEGVLLAVAGSSSAVAQFRDTWHMHIPPAAHIRGVEEQATLPYPIGPHFEIRPSHPGEYIRAGILPDLATCPECLAEIRDPSARRYQYPFTNCTRCGPRYSILESLPYDRAQTGMKQFLMCGDCRREYENPDDRRFHAQPIACPACGPHCWLQWPDGKIEQNGVEWTMAAAIINKGGIVALKGLGGFHLLADARNNEAVLRLRQRKQRDHKPLAVMFPSMESIAACCDIDETAEKWLTSFAAPIVLLPKRRGGDILAAGIAPHTRFLGAFLPYTPLHHLLLAELNYPVVATSGNLSDEPIAYQNEEAVERLKNVADIVLLHNRPIQNPMDDSVLSICDGRPIFIRRARGLAPTYVPAPGIADGWIGAGAQVKNAPSITCGGNILLGAHVGDLEHDEAATRMENNIRGMLQLHDLKPAGVTMDMHADYESSRVAHTFGVETIPIQHHHAHIAACMLEHDLDTTVLGIAWDGSGLGLDHTLWGGEFLAVSRATCKRLGHIRSFPLPGGESAIKEIRRITVGLLHDMNIPPTRLPEFQNDAGSVHWLKMIESGVNTPRTSSIGRLFDAVAGLLGVCEHALYEGDAAVRLESLASPDEVQAYSSQWDGGIWNWEPMLHNILADLHGGVNNAVIAARFHQTLAEVIREAAARFGFNHVVLSGGCFQNHQLLRRIRRALKPTDLQLFEHIELSPNDSSISVGQLIIAHPQAWATHFHGVENRLKKFPYRGNF